MQDVRASRFIEADFTGSQFRGVDFSNVKISDAWLVDVEISGHIAGLTINGVDVTAFVEQQLDERYPIRRLLTATDPDGMRQAWSALSSPNGGKTTVRHCLHVVFKEEWWHNQYAVRDLTTLEGR